jgi:hypothetical protein
MTVGGIMRRRVLAVAGGLATLAVLNFAGAGGAQANLELGCKPGGPYCIVTISDGDSSIVGVGSERLTSGATVACYERNGTKVQAGVTVVNNDVITPRIRIGNLNCPPLP